ncbi:spore wall protein 25-like [Vairimorpha necatrix]|uniref:Spore wall protein 25-like n=1 Tax=Vairimorpha necatrix TaxID=6039 RepID=A0AAX4J8Z5_9MICR
MNINYLVLFNILTIVKSSYAEHLNEGADENEVIDVRNETVNDKHVVLNEKPVDKDENEDADIENLVIDEHSVCIKIEYLNVFEFIDLISEVKDVETDYQKEVLIAIYTYFKSQIDQKSLLFTAASLLNTDNFTKMVDPDDNNKYKRRGLLRIKDSCNYKLLTKLSGIEDYYNYPEKLEEINTQTVCDTIKYYGYVMKDNYTVRNYLRVMGEGDYGLIKDMPDVVNLVRLYGDFKRLFVL